MDRHTLEVAIAALESLDVETLVACFADGFVFEDTAVGQTITTTEELRAYFAGLFALPHVGFRGTRLFWGASGGAAEWTWSGTSDESNHPYSIKGASIFELGEDGITREAIYYDPSAAFS